MHISDWRNVGRAPPQSLIAFLSPTGFQRRADSTLHAGRRVPNHVCWQPEELSTLQYRCNQVLSDVSRLQAGRGDRQHTSIC